MKTEEIKKRLSEIDISLGLDVVGVQPVCIYYLKPSDGFGAIDHVAKATLYTFKDNNFNSFGCADCLYSDKEVDQFKRLIAEIRVERLENDLKSIDSALEIGNDGNNKPYIIAISKSKTYKIAVYNFVSKHYLCRGTLDMITSHNDSDFDAFQDLINEYWEKAPETETNLSNSEKLKVPVELIEDHKSNDLFTKKDIERMDGYAKELTFNGITIDIDNPFIQYTNNLANVLLEKNTAYGDSFSKSIDDYGLKVIGIRLSDKYNRIKHLVNAGELKENDESLQDTLLDTAGYAILSLKYLKEHEDD